MADFRKLVAVSLLTGILAGLFLSVLQHYQTQPLILAAERFEAPDPHHTHDWQPEDGWQRVGFTVLFNILSGFGFALMLSAAMYWQGAQGYLKGLAWAAAGYLVFFAAPSLGLPPELPGTDSAALQSRQAWWIVTAVATAIGLFSLCLSKNRAWQVAGVIVLALPHILGAPHPEVAQATAPAALQQRFVQMSALSNGLFWLSIGAFVASLLPKFKL